MTEVIKINKKLPEPAKIARAAAIIKRGGIVAFPTETVYGLGADVFNRTAVRAIFTAKGRPADNPLIVHIADLSSLEDLAHTIPPAARKLGARFWPGPLTLVLPRRDEVPPEVAAALPTVAIRMPAHPVALALIRAAETPLVAPSANLSSRPSPTCAKHVKEDLYGRIDLIIDGGSTEIGMESTVLDLTAAPPVILRPGKITARDIEAVIGPLGVIDNTLGKKPPKSPGMKYRHYAPRCPLILTAGENFQEEISTTIARAQGRKVAVITFHQESSYRDCLCLYAGHGSRTVARRLFRIFRELEQTGADLIIVEPYPHQDGLAAMIQDRLKKAAGVADRPQA